MHRNQTFDHLALSLSNGCHIRGGGTDRDPKSASILNEMSDLCAPDFVLAGKAIHIGAGTADPAPFDHNRLLSGLCQMPGKVFSALAAPDDDVLILFRGHICVR